MNSKNIKVETGGGVTFLGLLGLLFIGLKLTGFIAWSWWWVLLPLYGGLAIAAILLLLAGFMFLVAWAVDFVVPR